MPRIVAVKDNSESVAAMVYCAALMFWQVVPVFRITILLLLASLAGPAGAVSALEVSQAWVRGIPPGQDKSAAYMHLSNPSAQEQRIIAVRSPDARTVEIHESSESNGMWSMRRLEGLSLPAGGSVPLQPGGVHLMVFGIAHYPSEGDVLTFLLLLESGEEVVVKAEVSGPAGR